MLYEIKFKDGTNFIGGKDYYNTKWKEIQDKPIKQIAFKLPDGNIMILHGYEAYNHFVEATKDMYGGAKNSENVGKVVLRYQYLMGKKGNKVVSFRITLYQSNTSKYKTGDLTRRVYEFGKEYNNQPTTGWRKGI